jgi:hypothetical protein
MIQIDGRSIYLGNFGSVEEAEAAYLAAKAAAGREMKSARR